MLQIILLSYVLLVFVPVCLGYRTGPPAGACGSMIPDHAAAVQTSQAPYTITTSAMSYQKDQNITVIITATVGSSFRGFFIQARSAGSTTPVGRFYKVGSDTEVQLMSCSGSTSNAVSHTSRSDKTTKQFIWNNPNGGDVTFQGTFVKVKIEFWTNVQSQPLTEEEATTKQVTTTQMPTTTQIATTKQVTTTQMPTTTQIATTQEPTTTQMPTTTATESPGDTATTAGGDPSTTRSNRGTVGDNTTPNSSSCTVLSVWFLTVFVISAIFST